MPTSYYITAELGAFKFAEYHLKIGQIKCMGLESYIVTLKVHNGHCSVNQVDVKQAHNDSELPTRRTSRRPFFLRSTKKFMWTCFSSDSLGKKSLLSKPVDKVQARGRHTSSTVLSTTNSRHFWRHLTLLDWSGAVQWEVLTPQDVKLKWNCWGVRLPWMPPAWI